MRPHRTETLRSPAGGPTGHAGALPPGAAGLAWLTGVRGAPTPTGRLARALAGRPFVNPAVDVLLIGGGLSLLLVPVIALVPGAARPADTSLMAWVLLLSTSAHFAASSARLYGKPGVHRSMPFLTLALPIMAGILFAAGLAWPGSIGPALETLYLTWSPYHYAAQAYGIAVFYAHRAGRRPGRGDLRVLWLVALVPFFYMLARSVARLVPAAAGILPSAAEPLSGVGALLVAAGLVAPAAIWARLWVRDGTPFPILTLLPLVSNAIWFFVLDPLDAFLWATIFHGVQYMALALAFRAGEAALASDREAAARAGLDAAAPAPGARLAAVAGFYLLSVALGYALFVMLPATGVALGGSYGDSRLLAVALVNIHHFIVDARVWRLRDGGATRLVVEAVR